MNINTLRDFAERGQRAQAAVDEIIEETQPKSDSQKLIEIKKELHSFTDGEQSPIATLDAIDSIVNYD